QLAQQVGAGAGESVFDKLAEVDIVGSGHRVVLSRVTLVGLFENHAVAVFRSVTTRPQGHSAAARTPSSWTQPSSVPRSTAGSPGGCFRAGTACGRGRDSCAAPSAAAGAGRGRRP